MNDDDKTKQQLIAELADLRREVAELKATRALTGIEEKYHLLFAAAADAVIVLDAQARRFIDANPRALALYGYTYDEFVQLKQDDITAEPTKSDHAIQKTLTAGYEAIALRYHRKKDGTVFPVELSGSAFTLDGRPCILGVIRDITERQQTENELKESEARLKRAESIVHIGHYEIDVASGSSIWSDEVFRIFGLSPTDGEPTAESYSNLIYPDDREPLSHLFETHIATGAPFDLVYRIIRPDNALRYVQSIGIMGKNSEGQPRIFGTIQDITEHQLVEEALRESEARYRQVLETVSEGIAVMRFDGIITTYNENAKQILGLTDAHLQGAPLDPGWQVIFDNGMAFPQHPSDGEFEIPSVVTEVLQLGHPISNLEFKLRLPDGSLRWIKANLNPMTGEDVPTQAVVASFSDITERKQLEEAYHVVVDSSLQGLILSKNGQIYFANQAAVDIFGYPLEELQQMSLADVVTHFVSEDRDLIQTRYLRRQAGHEEPPNYIVRAIRKDGQIRWVELFVTATIYRNEPVTQTAILDITERKLAEQQRLALELEQKRTEVLANFIRDVKHEASTSLTIIFASLHLLKQYMDQAQIDPKLAMVERHVRHIADLLDDILTMTKLDMTNKTVLEPVDVNRIVRMVENRFRAAAENKALSVTLDLSPDLPTISADQILLDQALSKLIDNAIRYTHETGSITLQTLFDDDTIIIEVQDTGIGIGAEDLPHIFERFYRVDKARSTRGAGLGLSIAEKIIQIHHGTIEVASILGEGSTFQIRLLANRDE